MEELGSSDWSLVTVSALIISTSALVLGHEREIYWVLLKYLQNYTKAGLRHQQSVSYIRVNIVNTAVTDFKH